MTVLAYAEADHSRRELGFQDGQLAMVRKRTPAGAIDFEVRYSDYHDIGGVMFAYKVEADFPAAANPRQLRLQASDRERQNRRFDVHADARTRPKQVDLGMRPSCDGSARWLGRGACASIAALADRCCCADATSSTRATITRKQQILYQAIIGDPRTFNPVLVTDAQFR